MSRLVSQLKQHTRSHPDRMAIISEHHQFNYRELNELLHTVVAALEAYNITHQSIVGIHIKNEAEHLIATLALLLLGAKQIAVPTYEPDKVKQNIVADIGISHILSDNQIFPEEVRTVLWNDIRSSAPHHCKKLDEYNNQNGTLMVQTSGSTGKPKTFELTETQLSKQAERTDYSNEYVLRLAPIQSNGSKRHRIFCTWLGATNVFRPSSDDNLVKFCIDNHVTCIDASRVHITNLIALDNANFLSDVTIRSSGMELPFKLRKAIMEKVSAKFYFRYATTEIGNISIATPEDHDQDDSVGKVVDGVNVEIVSSDKQPVKRGDSGEIRIKAPGMATEYINNVKETKHRFIDGWFYPGDIGYFRDDGHLVINGRKKDMMILNGINIYPNEIQKVLENHPDIAAAAVFPLASDIHGQIPVAIVEVNNKNTSKQTLLDYCRLNLGTKSPRQIVIAPEIPRNTIGKIARSQLQESFKKWLTHDRTTS